MLTWASVFVSNELVRINRNVSRHCLKTESDDRNWSHVASRSWINWKISSADCRHTCRFRSVLSNRLNVPLGEACRPNVHQWHSLTTPPASSPDNPLQNRLQGVLNIAFTVKKVKVKAVDLYSASSCTPKAGGEAGGPAIKPPLMRSRHWPGRWPHRPLPTACTLRPGQRPDRWPDGASQQ